MRRWILVGLSILPTTQKDIEELSSKLRKSDIEEVLASHNFAPKEAVSVSVELSTHSYAVRVNNALVMIYGVSMLHDKNGASPWMLATDELQKHAIKFYRITKKHVDEMYKQYGYLENYVDARNALSIRWLKWLGFTIHKAEPYGIEQLLFHRFTMGGG